MRVRKVRNLFVVLVDDWLAYLDCFTVSISLAVESLVGCEQEIIAGKRLNAG